MKGSLLKGLIGLLGRHWGKATIAGAGAYMYRDKIGEAVQGAVADPGGTLDDVRGAFDSVGDTLDSGREKIDGAAEFVQDPLKSTLGNTFAGAGGSDNDGEGFDWWNLAKWGGGIGVGGWLLSKLFGGGNKNENDSGGGMGFGTILMIGIAALAFFNRDKIMDLVSGNDSKNENTASGNQEIDFMDPDALEIG